MKLCVCVCMCVCVCVCVYILKASSQFFDAVVLSFAHDATMGKMSFQSVFLFVWALMCVTHGVCCIKVSFFYQCAGLFLKLSDEQRSVM